MAERSARAAIFTALLLISPMLLGALTFMPASAASGNPWFLRTVGMEPQAIYEMAIGKVDPKLPGDQLVLTGGGGLVNEYDTTTFQVRTLFAALRTQETVAIGDVQSEYTGNEVVTAGQDGKVHVIHRESNGAWVGETAWAAPPPSEQIVLHSVRIGEFNASHQGKEIAVVGMDAILVILTEDLDQPNGWSAMVMQVQKIKVDNTVCISAAILPGSTLDQIIIGSASNNIFLVRWDERNRTWNSTEIWKDVFPNFGMVYGTNLVPGMTGPTIYTSSLSGRVSMLHYNGTGWTNTTIYQEPYERTLHRVTLADIDPRYPGPELIAGGISSNLHIIHYSNGNWTDEDVKDPSGLDRLKNIWDIKAGEVDSSNQGPEIFVAGMGQELLEPQYIEPNFELVPQPSEQTVVSGHDAHFWISLNAVGYFSGDVALSSDAYVSLSKTTAKPGDTVKVTVHTAQALTEEVLKVNVTGKSLQLGITRTATLTVASLASTVQGFEIQITPEVQYTTPGFSTYFVVKPTFINGWSGIIDYTMTTTMPLDYSHIGRSSDDIKDPAIATLTPSALMGSGSYPVIMTFHGRDVGSTHFFKATAVAMVVVDAGGVKDFTLAALPQEVTGVPNSTLRFDLTLNSPSDFTDKVLLSVDGIPQGSTGSFSSIFVSVPTKVTFALDIGKATLGSYYVISFLASGGSMEHAAPVIVHVIEPTSSGDFGITILPPIQMARPGATAYFLLHITGGVEPSVIKVLAGGPLQATIQNGRDGNHDYRLMTVTLRRDASPGVYKGTVTASKGWEHNTTFVVIVPDTSTDIDLELVPKDVLISPGQWPTVHLNATGNRDMLIGKTLKYSVIGLGVPASYYTIYSYNYDKSLLLPMPDLVPATYLYLLEVFLPNSTYPRTILGTLTMTAPVALLGMHVGHGQWTYREGAINSVQVTVVNNGLAPASDVNIEVLLDGKSVDRQVLSSIPARSQSRPVDLNWSAASGEHNLTVIIFVNNGTGRARILDPPYSVIFKISPWSLKGPAISLLLILLVAMMSAATVTARTNEKRASGHQRARPKSSEEE